MKNYTLRWLLPLAAALSTGDRPKRRVCSTMLKRVFASTDLPRMLIDVDSCERL